MSARELRKQVVVRKVTDIILGTDTGVKPDGSNVTSGWAMGPFYRPGTAACTKDFELKEWGGKNYGGATFRPNWEAHTDDGNEYIRVVKGTLSIFLGEDDGSRGIRQFEEIKVGAGESIVLPSGLFRRFEGSDDVLALTVRRGASREWMTC